MQSIDWLLRYDFAQHALVAGVAVGTVCSLLSVIVVLKRMAFIGQGISHAGFGGVGTAVFLGLSGLSQDLMIFLFCLGTAVLIGFLSRRRQIEADSAIGILLVAAMAWGVLLDQLRVSFARWPWYVEHLGGTGGRGSYELLLAGSLHSLTWGQTAAAVGLSAAVLLAAGGLFKELLFYTFDEASSRVFGLPARLIDTVLLVMLAVVIVMSVRLVGFILVTALLVIPGAAAMQLSRRLGRVLLWAWLVGLGGIVGGLLLSFEIGFVSPGPCIVAVLCGLFTLAMAGGRLRGIPGGRGA